MPKIKKQSASASLPPQNPERKTLDGVELTGTVYDNPAFAAVGFGISKAQILWARKQGAPGFAQGRIHHDLLLPWLRENEAKLFDDELDKNAWECRRLRLQCQAIEDENERIREGFVTKEIFENMKKEIVAAFTMQVYAIPSWLSIDVAGNPPHETERKMVAAFDSMMAKVSEG
jgi:hypothetical protein